MNYRRASPEVSDFSMKNLSIDRKFIYRHWFNTHFNMPTQMACRYLNRGKPELKIRWGIKPTPSNKMSLQILGEVVHEKIAASI
jgi:hypothetical protein